MVKTRMPFQLLLVMPTPLSKSSSRISTPCSVGLVFLDSTHALTWQLSFWTRDYFPSAAVIQAQPMLQMGDCFLLQLRRIPVCVTLTLCICMCVHMCVCTYIYVHGCAFVGGCEHVWMSASCVGMCVGVHGCKPAR